MSEKAWLDVSVFQCPRCERCYVDASWYVVELESDIECGSCHEVFNIETARAVHETREVAAAVPEKC